MCRLELRVPLTRITNVNVIIRLNSARTGISEKHTQSCISILSYDMGNTHSDPVYNSMFAIYIERKVAPK